MKSLIFSLSYLCAVILYGLRENWKKETNDRIHYNGERGSPTQIEINYGPTRKSLSSPPRRRDAKFFFFTYLSFLGVSAGDIFSDQPSLSYGLAGRPTRHFPPPRFYLLLFSSASLRLCGRYFFSFCYF